MAITTKNHLVQNVGSAEVEEPYLLVFYKTINYYELLQTTTEAVAENSTKLFSYSFAEVWHRMNELKPGVGRAGFLAGSSTGESLYLSFEDIHISYFISWLLGHFLHLKGRKASLSWVLLTGSSHDYLEFTWVI